MSNNWNVISRSGDCGVNDRFTQVIFVSNKYRDILYMHTHRSSPTRLWGLELQEEPSVPWVGLCSDKECELYKHFLYSYTHT